MIVYFKLKVWPYLFACLFLSDYKGSILLIIELNICIKDNKKSNV